MNTATKPAKVNTFAALSDVMTSGFDGGAFDEMSNPDYFSKVKLDDIEIKPQIRDELEDEDNTLADLGKNLRKRQAQNIIVRPNPKPGGKPFELVAGERRVRGGRIEGLTELWALVAELTDQEAEEIQAAENIQRKNLTQIELARRVKRDHEALGSVEAVLAKYDKSRGWLSKVISLTDLPPSAKRLVSENISADMEVISSVRQIEQRDPVKAKALVDDLKAKRGDKTVNVRDTVAKVKNEVKPPKADKRAPKDSDGPKATPKDRSHEEPGEGRVFAPAKTGRASGRPLHEEALTRAYFAIFDDNKPPKGQLDGFSDEERDAVEQYLHTFYEAGKQAVDGARTVVEGVRRPSGFATDGFGLFALVAYIDGMDGKAKFNVLNILGRAKP